MSRRIEIELTSDKGDGSWSWRAAGAREPRGVLAGSLLPSGSKTGDVLRAEVDVDLDGVTVTAIVAAPQKHRNEAERIELLGRPLSDEQLVTSNVTAREKRDRPPRRDRRDRPDGDGGRPPRDRRDRPAREGERRDRPPRERSERGERSDRERRPPRPRVEEPAKPKPKRLRPSRTHRNTVLESLPPEHRPIAEQVLQGDIPAVRQAIDDENAKRTAAGETAINGAELLAIAERLRSQLLAADWRDRAEAAMAIVDELDLRDLRSVVVGADRAARDDDTRKLAAELRDALARRVDEEHAAWLAELDDALKSGRTVRALRLSSRPPKAGSIFPVELSARLTDATAAALTADAVADRWAIVLDALAHSPVRTSVKPRSLPESPSDDLLATVRKLSSRLPEIAAQFGIEPAADAPRAPRGPRRPPARPPLPPKPPLPSVEAVPATAVSEPPDAVPDYESPGASTDELDERPRNSPLDASSSQRAPHAPQTHESTASDAT